MFELNGPNACGGKGSVYAPLADVDQSQCPGDPCQAELVSCLAALRSAEMACLLECPSDQHCVGNACVCLINNLPPIGGVCPCSSTGSCPNGCCDRTTGLCLTVGGSICGTPGGICSMCSNGQSCVGGVCTEQQSIPCGNISCPYQSDLHFVTVCNTCSNPPHCDIYCRGTATFGDGYVHCCAGCDCNDEQKCLSPGTPSNANYTDPGGTCAYGCYTVSQPGINCGSDRNIKENFASVDPQMVLERVAALPISTWNYIIQSDAVRHMGPMAQDFAAAFGVGEDDRHIHVLDGQGVALAAIQGLLQKVEEQKAAQQERINALEAQNSALQTRLEALERGRYEPK